MIEVRGLFLGESRFGVEIADVKGPLNIVLEARSGHRGDPNRTGCAANILDTGPGAAFAIDKQLLGGAVPPTRGLERFQLVLGQMLVSPLPNRRWFGDVGIAVKGSKIFGHRREFLDRHGRPPLQLKWPWAYRMF